MRGSQRAEDSKNNSIHSSSRQKTKPSTDTFFNTVPQSDVDAALRAIENVGHERISAAAYSAAQSKDDETKATNDTQEWLQQTVQSLRSNVQKLTNPIPDGEYEALLNRATDVNIILDQFVDDISSSESEDEEADTDYDADEEEKIFLDQDAVARVKDLRAKVRASSERIGKLRDVIPKQTAHLITTEMELIEKFRNESDAAVGDGNARGTPTKNLLVSLDKADDDNNGECTTPTSFEQQDTSTSIYRTGSMDSTMQDMEESLKKLNSLMETVNRKLPDELDSFQSTLEVVDNFVKKIVENQNELGEYVPSNPIERAILSPDDLKRRSSEAMTNSYDVSIPPEKRFLLYLQN